MLFRPLIWGLIILTTLASCNKEQRPPDFLSIQVPKDPHAGFADFLTGLAHLVEQEPLSLNLARNGKAFGITVYSTGHEYSPIEPFAIILTEEGIRVGDDSESKNLDQLAETLHFFVEGCKAAEVEPIVLVSSAKGISLEEGIELLGFMHRKGVNRIVVTDHHHSGPVPRSPLKNRKLPSEHTPTPPHIDGPGIIQSAE